MISSGKERFEKLRQLGAGSVGPIFEARDHALDRRVAIRELSQSVIDDQVLTRKIVERVEKMAAISHPNVMTVHAVEPRHQPPRFIVELLIGKTVADLLAEGPVTPERVAVLLGQGLEGLQQLHHHGMVHGDLRPSQLFVHRDALKVGDFGLAALGSRGERSSESVRYSSPEALAKGEKPSSTSDLFALGLIAYELTLGTERFLRVVVDRLEDLKIQMSSTASERLWRKLHMSSAELPVLREVDPTIPKQFSNVIARMLSKKPSERPESCGQALRELATMRGWTAMFEVVRQPSGRPEAAADPLDEVLRQLSPQRAAIALAVVATLALAVIFLRRSSDSHDSLEPVARSEPVVASLVKPADLLARLKKLVDLDASASLRLAGERGSVAIGEPVSFEVTISRDAYAALFVVSVDGTVLCLYPNRKKLHLRLEAGKTRALPGPADHLLGIGVKADLPVGEDDAFLLTSPEVLARPPQGQVLGGDWLLAFPFNAGTDNSAAEFLAWVERISSQPGVELTHLRYSTTAG